MPALDADKKLAEAEIRELAIVYKKESLRKLTDYQKRINDVSQEICVKNPTMLRNRKKLLLACQEEVNKTYQFKKGKSRSKRLAIEGDPGSSKPKRKKLTKDFRVQRMKTIEEEVKHLKERMSYKEKRRQMSEDQRNYKLCDEITEEISALSKECHVLEIEMKELAKKDSRSKVYHAKKKPISSTSSDNSTLSSVPASDESETESHDTLILSGDDDLIKESGESFQVGLPAVNDQGGQSAI